MVFINKIKIGYTYNLDVLPPFYQHVPHENGQFWSEAWGASHFPLHLAMGFWPNGEDANVQPQIHCVCSWGCRLTTICGHVFRLARWPSLAQHRNAAQLQNSTSMVHRGCHSDEGPLNTGWMRTNDIPKFWHCHGMICHARHPNLLDSPDLAGIYQRFL